MPDFFISFQVFPDWVNKFRTLRENIFGRIVKIEFCLSRETLWVSKKRERDHSEWPKSGEKSLHTEAMVFFVLFYGGKSCSLLLVVFVSSDFSTESEFFY